MQALGIAYNKTSEFDIRRSAWSQKMQVVWGQDTLSLRKRLVWLANAGTDHSFANGHILVLERSWWERSLFSDLLSLAWKALFMNEAIRSLVSTGTKTLIARVLWLSMWVPMNIYFHEHLWHDSSSAHAIWWLIYEFTLLCCLTYILTRCISCIIIM